MRLNNCLKRSSIYWYIAISPLLFFGITAQAEDVVFDGMKVGGNALPNLWRVKVKEGKKNIYFSGSNKKKICFISDKASFSIERKVDVDPEEFPVLKWEWKGIQLPKRGDLRNSETNDQAAQLFLVFDGWFPNKSISYVWDTNAPKGSTNLENWLVIKVRVIVVESGVGIGEWKLNSRNIYDDYKNYFGSPIPKLIGVRLQINSQHTGDRAEACFGALELSKQ